MYVYFDNASTTTIHPKVVEKIFRFLSMEYGNPSSIHSFGRRTRVALEESREIIANSIGAQPNEIYFTSSGTEAVNFSLFGIAKAEFAESKRNGIISSKADHVCVIDSLKELAKTGYEVHHLDVSKSSTVDIDVLEKSLSTNTSLVSLLQANNETGAISDFELITSLLNNKKIYFHVDAVQSFCKIPININIIKIDSLSVSAHKIGGPKGVGFSYIRSGTPILPLIFGGSQEKNLRAGTENVAGIIGFAEAVQISIGEMDKQRLHCSELRNAFLNGLNNLDKIGIQINSGKKFLPNILSVTFLSEYYKNDAEAMLMFLDIHGIAASNGAACSSGTLKPSHVILSLGYNEKDTEGTIRFSFSLNNTIEEVNYTLDILKKMIMKFKK
jgi:cysteine desulfurase